MKALIPKLWAKITAYILLVVMVLVFAASGLGIAYLVYTDAYTDGGRQARQEVVSDSLFWQQMSMLRGYYADYVESQQSGRQISDYYPEHFSEENNNFFFTIEDESGSLLLGNYTSPNYQYSNTINYDIILNEHNESESRLSFESDQERESYIEKCTQQYYNVGYSSWEEYEDIDGESEYMLDIWYTTGDIQQLYITGYVKSELTAADGFYTAVYWINRLISFRYGLIAVCILSFFLALFLFIFLLCSAGHKENEEGIYLNWLHKIPFDLQLYMEISRAGKCANMKSRPLHKVRTDGFPRLQTILSRIFGGFAGCCHTPANPR